MKVVVFSIAVAVVLATGIALTRMPAVEMALTAMTNTNYIATNTGLAAFVPFPGEVRR